MDLYPATFKAFVVQWSAKIANCRPQLKPQGGRAKNSPK